MTKLEQAAMTASVLSREQVADFHVEVSREGARSLCLSHERLRMELDKLTDPAPITEQGLRARGFVKKKVQYFQGVEMTMGDMGVIVWTDQSESPSVYASEDEAVPENVSPRTMGELEQLIRRVNGGGE